MREIKFRAWDKEKNVMVYDNDQKVGEIYNLSVGDRIHNTIWTVGNFYKTLMQYTGLKDKNDKEIYEGDIVHVYKEGWDVFPTLELIGKVTYENEFASFFISYKDDGLISFIDVEDSENIEIIGNIHENPELLENE